MWEKIKNWFCHTTEDTEIVETVANKKTKEANEVINQIAAVNKYKKGDKDYGPF